MRAAPVSANIQPDSILVTEDALPGRRYEPLGELKVAVNKITAFHPAASREQAIAKMQTDAAKLAANAIISVRIREVQITPLSWGTRTGTGVAVRPTQ